MTHSKETSSTDRRDATDSVTEVTLTYSSYPTDSSELDSSPYAKAKNSDTDIQPSRLSLKDLPENLIVLGDVIGQGGMGIVRAARQMLPLRDVAVKRLHFAKAHLAKNLMDEALTMGGLEHPNIVPVHLVRLTEDNSPEVVMKYVQGRSWNEILNKIPQRDDALEASLEILRSVCNAIEYAHAHNVIHRDIKPHNVMVGEFGEVYLMDWGIAVRLDNIDSVPKGLVGTPGYLAPEMLTGDPNDVHIQTDVFLLGSTLHTILTGKRRNDGNSIVGALDAAKKSEPYQYESDVPSELAYLTNRACSKEPGDRPNNAKEFRHDLESFISLREAYVIRDSAILKRDALISIIKHYKRSKNGETKIRTLFAEARFGLEQALRLAPDCAGAQEAFHDTLMAMIYWLLDNQHYDEADHLRGSLGRSDDALIARFSDELLAGKQRSAESQYLKRMAPDYDPTPSRTGRQILGISIMGIVAIACVAAIIYDTMYPTDISPKRLLISTGSVALVVVLAMFIARQWLFANRIGGRLFSTVVFGFLCAPIFAIAGLKGGFSGEAIMVGDTLLVGLTMANVYPIVRTGRWAALFALANVFAASVFPTWAQSGFMLSTAFSAACVVYDWTTREFKYADIPEAGNGP